MTRRQDKLSNSIVEKMVDILQTSKLSIQVDDCSNHNQATQLVYVGHIHEDDLREEMLLIKRLPVTTAK